MSVSALSRRLVLPLLFLGLAAMLIGFFTYRVTHPTLIKQIEIRGAPVAQTVSSGSGDDCCDVDHSAGGAGHAMAVHPELVAKIAVLMGTLQENPDDFAVRMELAEAFMQANDPAGAAQHLKKAVELQPEDSVAHYYLGIMLYALHRYEESVRSFEQSLNLEEDPHVMFNLALILLRYTDREAEGLALLERTAASDIPKLRESSRMVLEDREKAAAK
jgi:tetratricopeptide (TPR) repeat protein